MLINKKKIVYLIIFSLLNYVGCFSYQQVQKEEFPMSAHKDISLRINEKDSYLFDMGNYIVRNDTISGEGKFRHFKYGYEILSDYKGKVALKDIKEIRVKKIDVPITIIGVGMVVGLLVWIRGELHKGFFSGGLVGNLGH